MPRKPQPAPVAPPKRSHAKKSNPLPAHRPPFVPTKQDKQTVMLMVGWGIDHERIACVVGVTDERPNGISITTLRKYFRREINAGFPEVIRIVAGAHMKRIVAGDMVAIKWFQQSRMGLRESILVDDGKPADTPMRVIIEFLGDAAPARVEASAPRSGSRLPDDVRRNVRLVG